MENGRAKLRVPVLVDREAYDEFKAYSEITGVPVARLVRDAMHEYNEVVLKTRLEQLMTERQTALPELISDNVISIAAHA